MPKVLLSLLMLTAFSFSRAANEAPYDDSVPVPPDVTLLKQALVQRDHGFVGVWKTQIEQLEEALPRGQKLTDEFDARLDEATAKSAGPVDIFADPSYMKLQALKQDIDSLEGNLIASYETAWAVVLHRNDSPAGQQALAAEFIRGFHDLLKNSDEQRKLALASLAEKLHDSIERIEPLSERRDSGQSALLNELRNTLENLDLPDESGSYQETLPAIRETAKNLSDKTALAQDVAIGEEWARQVPVLERTGTFKNITGAGFPAKKWALTFDDGPHKTITAKIKQVLADHNTKATFFELSNQVKAYPAISKGVYDAGHEIGDHSIDHANLPKLTAAQVTNEVSGSRDAIQKSLAAQGVSYTIRYFRAPYGAGIFPPKSQKVMDAIAASGMTSVLWNVDSLDWQDKNSESVRKRVIKQMRAAGHGIILFHDIQSPTPTTLGLVFSDPYVTGNNIKFSGIN